MEVDALRGRIWMDEWKRVNERENRKRGSESSGIGDAVKQEHDKIHEGGWIVGSGGEV